MNKAKNLTNGTSQEEERFEKNEQTSSNQKPILIFTQSSAGTMDEGTWYKLD